MIGIDIIDLMDPLLQERKSSLRFILHPDDVYPENEMSFWLLWAAKEAIFKAHRKVKTFNPKRIQVTIYKSGTQLLISSGDTSGEVIVDEQKVIAIAKNTTGSTFTYQFDELQTTDASNEARQVITNYFKRSKGLDIRVETDTRGLPILSYRKLPISISHHGKFVAFVYPDF